jgi:hypothetical protein
MFKISRKVALYLYSFGIAASLATVGVVAYTTHSEPVPVSKRVPIESRTLDFPRCSEASGRYDVNCWYDDDRTHMVVNFNHGEWSYDMDAQTMTHHKR